MSKELLRFIPNVELVTLLLIVFSITMPLRVSILISIVFSLGQTVMYGVGEWTYSYLIVWSLFVVVTYYLRNFLIKKIDYVAIYSGLFGLAFGFFFAVPYFIVFNFQTGFAYWLKGIPFDIIHCVANYILALLLFNRTHQVFERMYRKYG